VDFGSAMNTVGRASALGSGLVATKLLIQSFHPLSSADFTTVVGGTDAPSQ
jgi:hypothetical protein